MSFFDSFLKDLEGADLAVFDIDNTIVRGRVANSVSSLIREERSFGRTRNYLRGICGEAEVALGTVIKSISKSVVNSENWGLNKVLEILGNARISRDRIEKASENYYDTHKVSGFEDLKDILRKDYDTDMYLSSWSADVFVTPVARKVGAVGSTSQRTKYLNDCPIGLGVVLKSDEGKFIQTYTDLNEMGYSLKNSIYFGDGYNYTPFRGHVKQLISSPLAKPELKRVANFKLNRFTHDYSWLANQLKNSAY